MGFLRILRQLFHWGPIIALSIIFSISSATVHCNLMYWPVYADGGVINLVVFLTWNMLTLYNYFSAVAKGPGYVPYGWKPVSIEMTVEIIADSILTFTKHWLCYNYRCLTAKPCIRHLSILSDVQILLRNLPDFLNILKSVSTALTKAYFVHIARKCANT